MTRNFKLIGAALAALMITGGVAAAQDLRIAPAAPPVHPAHYMYEKFAGFLTEESNGTMNATIIGPEVVALPQMKDALQSGLANIGNALPLYFAADFPETGVAGDLALL